MTPAKKKSGQRRRVTKPKREATAEEKREAEEKAYAERVEAVAAIADEDPRLTEAQRQRASLIRRKAALLDEWRSPDTDPKRRDEIRAEIDGPLASVPIMSHAERERLAS